MGLREGGSVRAGQGVDRSWVGTLCMSEVHKG